jgi:ATP-binding cassette subfamily B protein
MSSDLSKSSLKVTNKQVLAVYWKHLKRHPLTWIGLLLVVAIAKGADIFIPLIDKRLIDAAATSLTLPGRPLDLLWQTLVLIIGIRVIGWAFWLTSGFIAVWVISKTSMDLLVTGFNGVLKHSYEFFTSNFAGSLLRKIQRLETSFGTITETLLWNLFPSTILLIGIFIVLARSYPLFGAFMGAWCVLVITESFLFLRWKLPLDAVRAEKDTHQTGVLSDAVTNALNILQFNGQEREKKAFYDVTRDTLRAWIRSWRASEINQSIQSIANIILEAGLIALAIYKWQSGELTIGDFALLQGYGYTLTSQLHDTGRTLRSLFEAIADAKEMVAVLHQPVEITDTPNAKKLALKHGEISFNQVGFKYHSQSSGVQDLSLAIRGGEKVALVGPSGAGKSTLTKLLFRFYDITKGSITIDGQDIREITQDSLRQAISLVPQEPILFHRTILQNIQYGRPEATKEEVISAAKKARCHEFISRLPDGYETYVGERGIKLSGGERQRVAIARAILKNASMLVLDEATSSLDSESEALIQEALTELMKGKTTIVIAHRLSTVMQMDRILVLDGGKVVDEGTHADLIERDGLYQSLWNIQAGGFKPAELA